MTVAIICTALLGLLVFGLGLAISLMRGSVQQSIGYDSDAEDKLHKFVRAHGNATEYAPMLAILMLAIGAREPATWMLWVFGIATAARYVHAAGMILSPSLQDPHPLRFAGSLSTYLSGLALVWALVRVL